MLRDKHAKMEPGLRPVSYGRLGDGFTRVSALADLPISVRKVRGWLRSAIEAADLWILQEIDLQALLSHEGYAMTPHASPCSSIHAMWCASSRLIQLLCSRCL